MKDGLFVPLDSGSVVHQAENLDRILHKGIFCDADLSISVQRDRFALAVRVPVYEESVSHRRRWRLRRTLEVPLYEYHLLIETLSDVEVQDESETYEHRIDRVAYDPESDTLTIEATPPYSIRLDGAGHAKSMISRNPVAVGTLTVKTFGLIESQ